MELPYLEAVGTVVNKTNHTPACLTETDTSNISGSKTYGEKLNRAMRLGGGEDKEEDV